MAQILRAQTHRVELTHTVVDRVERTNCSHLRYPWSLTLGMELQNGIKDSENNWHLLNRRFGVVTKNNFFGVDDEKQTTEAKPYLFHVNHDGVVNELLKPWMDEGNPILYKDRLDVCVKQALKEFGQ